MDSLVVLLAVLAGGAVLAGIVAFVVLSAIASLVESGRRGVTHPARAQVPPERGCGARRTSF
jgi:hypothetical protein